MTKKFYHAFGEVDLVLDAFLDVLNPTGADIAAAQIRPYDGGVAPMLSTYGAVDALCDMTWPIRDAKTVFSPFKATPDTVSIIRSAQLQTILDAVNYVGNRVYVVCLNDHPLIYQDNFYGGVQAPYTDRGMRDDISYEVFSDVYHRMFVPNCEGTFDATNMTKIFMQSAYANNYSATAVRDWVALGNVFVNFYGGYRKYNGGGEVVGSTVSAIGDVLRVKKDDICLRPLDGGVPTEYTLTRAWVSDTGWNYWSTLPTLAGWTTSVLMSLVRNATEYPIIIEMVHDASGGVLISWNLGSLGTSSDYYMYIPAWWYPIFAYQYALGKAGYLGAVPAYNTE